MACATLDELKRLLKIDVDADDDVLTDLLGRVEAAIHAKSRRDGFEAPASPTTRRFDARRDVNGRELCLDRDLVAITSITNGDGAEVGASLYVTEPRNDTPYYKIVLKSDAAVNWTYSGAPENAIAVTGQWVYSGTVPDTVKQATLEYATWLYRRARNPEPGEDRVIISPDGSILMPSRMPGHIVDLLASVRRLI